MLFRSQLHAVQHKRQALLSLITAQGIPDAQADKAAMLLREIQQGETEIMTRVGTHKGNLQQDITQQLNRTRAVQSYTSV